MSGATSGSPGITLTPEETRLFGQLFSQHDTEGTGIILGDSARPLFERSGLPAKTLGQIWQLADVENRGFLDQIGFSKSLRMIYHVQHGKLLGPRLMTIPSGLPSFDHTPAPAEAVPAGPSQPEPAAAPASVASPVSSTRIPPLSTSDKQRFGSLFDRSTTGPTIDGNVAKDIFLKAHLPPDVLGKIWNLVDVQSRGSLTRNEFVLAMHLIQALISRTISEVPTSLPSGWIPWLEGASNHGARGSVSSVGSAAAPGPINWTITSSQLAQYKKYFDSLDTQKKGVLGGSETVPFLTQSKLGEEVLAQVWDLADLQGQGQFTPVEFSIAMYLIQAKLAGHELPEILPPTLLSSSKGSPSRVMSPVSSPSPKLQPSGTGSRPAPPTARAPTRTTTASSLSDLVSLDDYFKPMEPTQAPASAQSTGLAPVQRPGFTGPGIPASKEISSPEGIPMPSPGGIAAAAGAGAFAGAAATFVPSSSFGQKLINHTPASNNARVVEDAQGAVSKLNSDVNEHQAKLTQISSESKAADEQLSVITSQKLKLEQQIITLRQSYDSEASKVHQTQQELRKMQEAIQQLEKDQKLRESGLQALASQFEADNTKLTEAKTQHETLLARVAELEEQHTTHKTNLENLNVESENIRGQTETHNQRIAALEVELQQTLDAIESAKLVRDDAAAKVRIAEERAERLEAEVSATQQQHRSLLAETEQLVTAAAAHDKRAAAAEHTLAETHASIASEQSRQASVSQVGQQSSIPAVAAGAAGVVAGAAAAVAAAAGVSANSSPVSTHQTQPTDTPHSSPPNSDYTGYPAEVPNIPSFTLPMARPQSATSSVVNNPPQSVRGDLDVSQPQSPDFTTSEPVSGLVPPENLKLSDAGREVDDTDSFEFVDAREGEGRDEAKFASTGTLIQEEAPTTDFGAIQQLSVSESTETATDVGAEPVADTAEPVASAATAVDQPKRGDDFADAFDDLEEAVEDAEEDDFSGFGNASAQSTPNPTAAGPDEWQKLFEDASAAIPGASGPHEDAILELTSMGFGRQEVLAALERTDYNVSEATNILLDQE
ncbi:EH domain-containing and endocytosis protein 1 [Wickerhamiella sorbophila]|uniref:EH domain-containing and endocytosis protein 1 n=1 Tax=Wickerhamiella sorbophila TaxID=45607 RepID=A0A2T0FK24_9ASCO|nr:EH domain-containing and endocytosis protein 1 [Wickerhamiella sorbophila]PRT55332.1 EH domain-containing and endocytosis protein 1 [Wickerhamiella sorbophila]